MAEALTTTEAIYVAFGRLVRLHRQKIKSMTQERLAALVGLSRTSITNIEKGRQPVALHQLCALAQALRTTPDALLPSQSDVQGESWIAAKLPPGTDPEIASWASKLVARSTKQEKT